MHRGAALDKLVICMSCTDIDCLASNQPAQSVSGALRKRKIPAPPGVFYSICQLVVFSIKTVACCIKINIALLFNMKTLMRLFHLGEPIVNLVPDWK